MPASVSVHHPRYAELKGHLRSMRELAGMTQTDLAASLAVGQSFVSKIERGERYVDVSLYVDWCRACGVEPHLALRKLLKAGAWEVK